MTTSSSTSRPSLPIIATKAPSTAQSSPLNVVGDSKPSRHPSRAPPTSRARPTDGAAKQDPTSERATLALIRRTLVTDGGHGDSKGSASPGPIDGVLPPLTSSNEVDVQLYAIVAIVIKDFVNSWYSKITPDRTFVDEVIQLIAHCSRAVEQRIRQIDIPELVLDELPALVERHVAAYRTATTAQAAVQYGESPRRIYHALNPHPALDPRLPPEQRRDYESAYRQLLVQGALAVLLPTEDLANACLRTLVSDIIADLILGQALADKLCQPWFLHGTVSKVVDIVTSRRPNDANDSSSSPTTNAGQEILDTETRQSRLEKFGLLTANKADREDYSSVRRQSSLSAWFWSLLQFAFIAYQSLRLILVGMIHAHGLPRRLRHHPIDTTTPLSSSSFSPPKPAVPVSPQRPSGPNARSPRAVINYRIFSCISAMLHLSVRMPWLAGSLAFCQHLLGGGPGRYGAANSTLDKFLYHAISTRVFSPALLPPLLLQIRVLIFPNNALGPSPPPPPTAEEARLIRSRAALDLLSLMPRSVARTFLAVPKDNDDEEQMQTEIEDGMLDWTDDVEMNKSLIYAILEHVVLRLVPEMRGKTPSELLAERGVLLTGGDEVDDGHGPPLSVVVANGEGH